ncbi:MAG: CapA family protein [Lachnospiraceae bacterium]|nr:CapA family protein [Lachnospiraceae bacterium]
MARNNSDFFGLEREDRVRKQKLILTGAAAAVILAVILIVAFTRGGGGKTAPKTEQQPPAEEVQVQPVTPAVTPEPTPVPVRETNLPSDPSYTEKVTILSTGDNLIHESLYQDAEAEDEEGYYDFRPMYRYVKPLIEAADMATVNMETPLATSIGKPSGYPHFNSPRGAGYALIDAGFDVINHANNHIMDMGTEGIIATINYWDGYDTPMVGAYRDQDDLYTMRILEKNGIKVAFLGIAEFTNYDIPDSSSVIVPFFSDNERVENLIKTAKKSADIVVVHAHWGEEDLDEETETMTAFSQMMVDWGADIIFGNHTHIVQDLKILTRESDGQLCPVIMSNGNFISGQKARANLLSGLEVVTAAKNPETGAVQIQNVEYLPVLTHYEGDRKNVVIIPLDQYTDEMAAKHGVVDFEGEPMTISYMEDLVKKHIPEEFLVTSETISIMGGGTASAATGSEAAASAATTSAATASEAASAESSAASEASPSAE